MVAMGNVHVYLKYGKNYITNNGDITKKFIFPILLLVVIVVVVVVVVVVFQFRPLYLKNCKWYKSETLHTDQVP